MKEFEEREYTAYIHTLTIGRLREIIASMDVVAHPERAKIVQDRYHELVMSYEGEEDPIYSRQKYLTVWLRLGAKAIDLFAVSGISWAMGMFLTVFVELQEYYIRLLLSFTWTLYSIGMIALYGQTVGKFFMHVVVVSIDDARASKGQALRREIIPFSAVATITAVSVLFQNREFVQAMIGYLYAVLWIWIIMDTITIQLNGKRRALHDLVAGTVVIRTQETSFD